MSSERNSKLFQPFKLGHIQLKHRVVLAPLTRMRNLPSHVAHNPLVMEYYQQRSSVPGTLIISEGTIVAAQGLGWRNGPGIWSDEQVAAWKEVTRAVHANDSYAFMQLCALGRAADPASLLADSPDPSNPYTLVGPSPITISTKPQNVPRELTIPEIHEYVDLFGQAAVNAVKEANFDGVELHFANGYLLDQFLSDKSNLRTDEYGGSIEGRLKFPLEVLDRVVEQVGAERVAIRLSPWSPFQDVLMDDPIPTYTYIVNQVKERHPNLAFIHVIEPRIAGSESVAHQTPPTESNDFIRKLWAPRPIISAGSYTRESAIKQAEDHDGELIAFGRWFISNPDLPTRLKNGTPLTPYNRSTFYTPGDREDTAIGYTDYPFAKDEEVVKPPQEGLPGGRADI